MVDKKVAEYINKQKPSQKEICLVLREIILRTCPGIKEKMRWGAIVYGGGRYYLGVVRYGVNLGFAIGGLTKEEIGLFEGSGKTMRHIKINSVKEIDEKKLVKLIEMVYQKAVCRTC